ncbi:unnamed protein product [Cladocopium goreaui]|uniref:Uncharacterized protein n=1 Tax=Cladocopium goreaui TaxID=2562237 RepID=A0A9P1CNT8_9DINO|nr:unnamed protein product [Cladocopium goreaui]
MPTSVSIQPCSGGKCLVAELDFEMGEVVLEETPLLEMPDDSVLSFSATSHYEAAWLYSQHCLSKDSFGALLSLGLSEGAASSGKVEEVKKALTKVSHAEYEMALRFLVSTGPPPPCSRSCRGSTIPAHQMCV